MKATDIALALVAKASEDIHVLSALRSDLQTTDAIWGFHAQQAVEKLLKALLTKQQTSFPFTHRLPELADIVDAWPSRFSDHFEPLLDLTPYAVEYRYSFLPGNIPEPALNRANLLLLIEEFQRTVESEIRK